MRALCLLLMLTACASPQRGEYRQSAFPPSAPAFNPAWDAPHTVGQPGYIGAPESVPRSPHKRYLPPTKEPGLWAGDGARASADPLVPVFVDGILLPYPDDAKTLSDVHVIKMCSNMMPHAMRGAGAYPVAPHLTPAERGCIVASYLRDCVAFVLEMLSRSMPGDAVALEKQAQHARANEAAKCTGGARTPAVESITAMRRTWDIRRASP